MMRSTELPRVLKNLGLSFDPELGMFVNDLTKIPLSIYYDRERGEVRAIDQTRLPYELRVWKTGDWKEILAAIKRMVVRGAPLIGCAGAFALALAAKELRKEEPDEMVASLERVGRRIVEVRPTGVDVRNNVARIIAAAKRALDGQLGSRGIAEEVERETLLIFVEGLVLAKALQENGVEFIEDGDVIMTHCNAGSLATPYGGSALGIMEEALARSIEFLVIVKETRPRCQGYKLTTWELLRAQASMIVVTDNTISSAMRGLKVTKVLVGADRITRGGFVANKIGTCDIAIISSVYNIPFLVAAPYSTLDLGEWGGEIPIEERDPSEITAFYSYEALSMKGRGLLSDDAFEGWPPKAVITSQDRPSPGKIRLYNPAFDVTPPDMVSRVILDIGVYRPDELRLLSQRTVKEEARRVIDRYMALLGAPRYP